MSQSAQKVYDALNREGFDGRLPWCTVVSVPPAQLVSETGVQLDGLYVPAGRRISVGTDLMAPAQRRRLLEVLIHECGHVVATGHGPVFQAELARLATQATVPWIKSFIAAECRRCHDDEEHSRLDDFERWNVMGGLLRKTNIATVVKASGRTRTFCITNDGVDRDLDTISSTGWNFSEWLKNPVVLACHDTQQWPIARGSNLRRRGNSWLADFTFAETPEGETTLQLVDAGMLSACSVGFRPLESQRNSTRGGIDFLRQELLEVSIVPVGANAAALVQRASALGLSANMVQKMFGGSQPDDGAVVLRLTDEASGGETFRFEERDLLQALRETLPAMLRELKAELPVIIRREVAEARRMASIPPLDPHARHHSELASSSDLQAAIAAAAKAAMPTREELKAEIARALARARGRVD